MIASFTIAGPLFPAIDSQLTKKRIVVRSFSSMARQHLSLLGESSSFGEQTPIADFRPDGITVTGVPVRVVRADEHEPMRLAHGQRFEQQAVEDRKDCRVGADAERQRQNGDAGHDRRRAQRPPGIPEVVHGRLGIVIHRQAPASQRVWAGIDHSRRHLDTAPMITRHRAWRGFGCACLLLIAGARGVRAQQSVAPEPVKPPQLVKLTLPELSNLRTRHSRRWRI